MSMKQIFLLTDTGIHETTTDFSSFSTTSVVGSLSVGCLIHDIRKPAFWYGDESMWIWRMFSPDLGTPKPLVYANAWKYVRSAQFDQMTGNAFFLIPFGESLNNYGKITKYTLSTRTESQFVLKSANKEINIFYALDMKIDSARRRIWILDAGNKRVIRANVDTGNVDRIFSPNGMLAPCSMTIDLSTGDAYIRCLSQPTGASGNSSSSSSDSSSSESTTHVLSESFRETIYKVDNNSMIPVVNIWSSTEYDEKWITPTVADIQTIIENNDAIPAPCSDSMKFDHLRNNLWWTSKGEERIVFMMNVKSNIMTSLSLPCLDYISAIAIDHDSGEALVCGSNGGLGYVLDIDKTCSVENTHAVPYSSYVNNVMIMGPEFGNLLPFYVNGVSGSDTSIYESSSSSSDDINVCTINNSLIAEPQEDSMSESSGTDNQNPVEETIVVSPIVTIRTWSKSPSVSNTRVWTAKNNLPDESLVDESFSTPMFSWSTRLFTGKPVVSVVTPLGDFVKLQYDQSAKSLTEKGRCLVQLEGPINGLSVSNGDGNVYVSGNGSIAKINLDPTTPGETASSLSESSSSSNSGTEVLETSEILVSQKINDTGIGGISVQFHSKAASIYAVSPQDGTLISFNGLDGWQNRTTYGPLPMPFKAIWSSQHSGVVVACKHSVHMVSIPSGTIKSLYGVPDYDITDICVMDGDIGMSVASSDRSNGLFKILASDLSKNRILYRTNGEIPTASCFVSTGKVIVALERLVKGKPKTRFVRMEIGKEPEYPSSDIDGSVVSLFLDENFGIVFSVFSSGKIITITTDGIINNISYNIAEGVSFAKGSLVDSLEEIDSNQQKVRVFVGSVEGANDRWDSGEIETSEQEIIYGGGNNLEPGEAYWLSVAVMDKSKGWSEPFSKCFIVPIM